MTSEPALPSVIGAIADDQNGNPLGTVTALFLDDVTGQPTWVGLTDGLHAAPDDGDVAIVAPIAGADFSGGRLRLPVSAEAVRRAPRLTGADRLSPAEEVTLREHYAGGSDPGGAGAGSGTDGAMTRSAERLRVDTVTEPWTRAVLRVETVTEEVLVPVTVTRQQARIEYLPLRGTEGELHGTEAGPPGDGTDRADGSDAADRADGGDVADRADVADREHSHQSPWVTLYTEQPVITLERVPAERVRLRTSWVTEQQTVADRLRHEEIALESDLPPA